MEGITLGTSPGGACPDDTLTRIIPLHFLPKGLVITQRIEVVLVETTFATMIETVVRRSFTKVALDGGDTLLQQTSNLRLIPADSCRIREVEDRILYRHTTRGVHYVHALLDNLRKETVLRGEVRQLPQTGVEAILSQLLKHLHRILETILRKLIVALPIDTKPACIEVDHVTGDLVSPQLLGNLKSLFLREIRDTTHPGAKAPEGQHRTLTRNLGILVEDILRFTQEHEEIHQLVSHKQAIGTNIAGTEITGHRC